MPFQHGQFEARVQREYVSSLSPGWISIEHIQGEDRAVALCSVSMKAGRNAARSLLLLPAIALLVAGCEPKTKAKTVEARPVRTITAAKGGTGGNGRAHRPDQRRERSLAAFRIGGRIIERTANVGDRVTPDQVLAKLDPQNELNALRSAQAALSAAEGRLVETSNTFDRQKILLPQGFTTQALFDQAQQALRTAQSQVDNAEAQLHIAKDRVELHASSRRGSPGSITARTAESGEVVQAGQPIFQVARQDGRDAVFDVPAQVIARRPPIPRSWFR